MVRGSDAGPHVTVISHDRNDGPRHVRGWSWVTGEPWAYTSWTAGEPNDWPSTNVENGEEQYLSMVVNSLGGVTMWNDNTPVGVPSRYLVEYDLPEPASAGTLGAAAGMMLLTRRRRRA